MSPSKLIFFRFFLIISVILIYCENSVEAQKKIQYSAEWSYHDDDILPGITKLVNHVVFSQGEVIGYCDSAYFHENENIIEAFGKRVKIHINDSVTLYGQYLIYDGDAKLSSISRKVVLEDKTSKLYTDSLLYNLNTSVGYYLTGGKMVNKDNVLTSIIGYYHTNTNMVFLHNTVKLVNETYTMTCDSISFNSNSEIVYFLSRTHLVSEENEIFTTDGWYDTKNDISLLIDDVQIYGERNIFGDTLFYDKTTKAGQGWKNVVVVDTIKDFILKGNYVEYYEVGGTSIATDSALLILLDGNDSLYVHADMFHIYTDSVQEVEKMLAFNHVKFFRNDMQGACDSLVYLLSDSMMTMFMNPVVWSEEYQLTADTIFFFFMDSNYMKIHLSKSAFIVSSQYSETEFNQIKGLNIYGHIYDKVLTSMDVIGNAECLYYIQEEDTSLIGINTSFSNEMTIRFLDKTISSITLYDNSDGKIYPDAQLGEDDRKLKDFRWLIAYRPLTVLDIFHTPIPRNKNEDKTSTLAEPLIEP
jgi:hypothetical protein